MTPTALQQERGGFGQKLRTFGRLLRGADFQRMHRAVLQNAHRLKRHITPDGCRFAIAGIDKGSTMWEALLNGTYELPERHLIAGHLNPHLPVIELGGCMGVVACITNRRLSDPSAHVVVEMNPEMLPLLNRNARLNGATFSVVNAAIEYDRDVVPLAASRDPWTNRLDEHSTAGGVMVPATTLRAIVQKYRFADFSLICDIEGHEYELLQHEAEAVALADLLILETHERFIGKEKNDFVLGKLRELGFCTVDQIETVMVLQRHRRPQ